MILLVSFDIYYFLIGHFDYGTQTKNYGEETKTPAFKTSNYIFRKLEKTLRHLFHTYVYNCVGGCLFPAVRGTYF